MDDIQVIIPRREHSSRFLALATLLFGIPKAFMLIPHFIVLYFLGLAMVLAGIFAQFVVLFTGKYPSDIHTFITNVTRWQVRTNAFFFGLTDKYPPFQLNS